MHTHLSAIADPEFKGSPLQGMSEQTAMLLVAVCIRWAQIHAQVLSLCRCRPKIIASEACTSQKSLLEGRDIPCAAVSLTSLRILTVCAPSWRCGFWQC